MQFTRTAQVLSGVVLAASAGAYYQFVTFPAEAVLGDKVRLPIFHGALTWVNMTGFTLMGLCALAYLVVGKEALYRAAFGLRMVSVPVWVVGSAMGYMAAMKTWDFSASQTSPWVALSNDPRLMAQFWVLLLALLLLVVPMLLDTRRQLAVADTVFVVVMWTLLSRAIWGPGKALHPDNPILNSGSDIQIPFFLLVGCLAVAVLSAAALVSTLQRSAAPDAAGSGTESQGE